MTEASRLNQTIGDVARQFSVSARTLRYYEQIGLLTGDRDWSGYRSYDPDAIDWDPDRPDRHRPQPD